MAVEDLLSYNDWVTIDDALRSVTNTFMNKPVTLIKQQRNLRGLPDDYTEIKHSLKALVEPYISSSEQGMSNTLGTKNEEIKKVSFNRAVVEDELGLIINSEQDFLEFDNSRWRILRGNEGGEDGQLKKPVFGEEAEANQELESKNVLIVLLVKRVASIA